MAGPQAVSGNCLCGAVTFTTGAAALDVAACHCSMCERWAAGPLLALTCDAGSLKISGENDLPVYQSSDWGERCFCRSCGSALLWRARDGSHFVVSAGVPDEGGARKFALQISVDEKPSYYAIANETVKMTGLEFIAMMTAGDTKD